MLQRLFARRSSPSFNHAQPTVVIRGWSAFTETDGLRGQVDQRGFGYLLYQTMWVASVGMSESCEGFT